MARPGWNAKGLLQPLWKQYPGGRDALAEAVGTTGASLSSRNSGRVALGEDLGGRLAEELSRVLGYEVSLQELGAPLALCGHGEMTLRSRLEELEAEVAQLQDDAEREQTLAHDGFEALRSLLRRLEERLDALDARGQAES